MQRPQYRVLTVKSCTKCAGSQVIIKDRTPDGPPVSWEVMRPDLTTERRFDSHATWFIGVLGLFFEMLSMEVYATRPCQTSGRLVQ